MFSHAYLKQIGIASSLWSVSRGLARRVGQYKSLLSAADNPRQGDLDGRGNLSQKGLEEFCKFFLSTCIDQLRFMEGLLSPAELLGRMGIIMEEEIRAKRMPQGSFALLKEGLLLGSFERGKTMQITGYKERQARSVLKALLDKGLLTSKSERGPVRPAFPQSFVERLFPGLYPD